MSLMCSFLVFEDDVMKCVGEWFFVCEDEMVWYLCCYFNVILGMMSLVSFLSFKDSNV